MKILKAFFVAFFSFSVFLFSGSSSAGQDVPGGQLMVIVDSSGSMWGIFDGQVKMNLAKHVVQDALMNVDEKSSAGLVVFGKNRKGDCNDIEVMLPFGSIYKPALLQAVSSLKPNGKTPLAEAIFDAVKQLQERSDLTRPSTILLISDGKDTCGQDPCMIAQKLREKGDVNFVVDVIGLAPKEQAESSTTESDYEQLRCIAEGTGGKFYPVNKAQEFALAVQDSVNRAEGRKSFSTDEEGIVDLLTQKKSKKQEIVEKVNVIGAGFISQPLPPAGEILSTESSQRNLYLNERLRVRIPGGAKKGDHFLVYNITIENVDRADDPSGLDPITKRFLNKVQAFTQRERGELGALYHINSVLEVTGHESGDIYIAQIIQFFDNTVIGEKLLPVNLAEVQVPERYFYMEKPKRSIDGGAIVATKNDLSIIGLGNIVYIDKGSADGVMLVDDFDIYSALEEMRYGGNARDKNNLIKVAESFIHPSPDPHIKPTKPIGRITVISVREHTSTAVVTSIEKKALSRNQPVTLKLVNH